MKFEILRLPTIDSTNKHCFRLIDQGHGRNGLVVITDEQTEGRGHADNKWLSEKGKNLTFSLMIKPDCITPANQFLITHFISLALQNELSAILNCENISVKWPNDIYAEDHKIAGVLVQNVIKGSEIDFSVIGIGLNVNQKIFDPALPNPSSLSLIAGHDFDLGKLLEKLLNSIDFFLGKISNPENLNSVQTDYLEKLFKAGKWSNYLANGVIFKAKIKGLGPYGQLILLLENGNEAMFSFKEVEFIL